MQVTDIFSYVCMGLSVLFVLCYFYQFVYIPISLFKKSKPHKYENPPLHNFAVLVSARNEEKVILNLINSIKAQTYPKEKISIFLVADNCTDNTADIARKNGVTVYERFNEEKIGKGYALEYLYENIVKDFGKNAFDAYFVFDADNVLDIKYVEEMNKTYSDGYPIVASYRNSKNFDDNWISSGYALWFLRDSRYLNYPRMLNGTSCCVAGTGFMFDSSVIEETGGWKFFLLTEDIEFSYYHVIEGKKIGYCKDAYFYDEQPTKFMESMSQRLRWTKGYMQVWRKHGKRLLRSIFSPNFASCYDMTMGIMPALIISVVTVLLFAVGLVVGAVLGEDLSFLLFQIVFTTFSAYLATFTVGFITTLSEWKKIHCSNFKKILYTFTFPFFLFTFIPLIVVAFVKKDVKWKHISHDRDKTLDDIVNR